jgi:hypothetical protein
MAAHSTYSASGGHRWLECPGSLALSSIAGPSQSGMAAKRGTAAHEVAANLLQGPDDVDPITVDGTEVEVEGEVIVIDEDLTEQVCTYVQYVRGLVGDRLIEVQSDYGPLLDLEDAWGTSDAVVIEGDNTVNVIDLKTGRHWVGAEGNTQLLLYAAGVVHTLDSVGITPSTVRMHIVQPAVTPVPATWSLSFEEFLTKIKELKQKAQVAKQASEEYTSIPTEVWRKKYLKPSEEACKYCPAARFCPALREATEAALAIDTDALSVADLNKGIKLIPLLETWINAIQANAVSRASKGEEGLDFKMVLCRQGNRQWVDEDKAEEAFASVPLEQRFKPATLVTPAQMEKVIKKLKRDDLAEKLGALTKRNPAKPTLTAKDDPRPAWIENDIADEFETC